MIIVHGPMASRSMLIGWWAGYLLIGGTAGCSRDMEEQPSYQAQEAPRLHSPQGSVPRDSRVLLSVHAREGTAVADGASLFRINCAHCHGSAGAGDGPVAGYLKELPANLQAPRVQDKSVEELYAIVTHGKDMMPPFRGELSAHERWSVAQYVKEQSASPAGQEPP
jgi:mono/diheme cytochrome c family protein